jgi:2-(3-amino-3-carboxypropyl)histidine synthase
MKNKTISELNEKYDLELDRVVSQIKKQKSKLVLLQFPDGLKPYATCVVDYLRERINSPTHSSKSQMSEKTKAEFLIWFGTCFGACDTPVGLEKIKPKIDLIIQFGHNEMMPTL